MSGLGPYGSLKIENTRSQKYIEIQPIQWKTSKTESPKNFLSYLPEVYGVFACKPSKSV